MAYQGSGKKSSDKPGITSGTTFIKPCPPQDKSMDSSSKSQKPLANLSEKASGGHTIR